MKKRRIDIASIRREQIIEAAVAIIAEQGLQNLSLSEIEKKAGMSRGQLTYYFPAKEDILLAVFDRLLAMMCQRHGPADEGFCASLDWWAKIQQLLSLLLEDPPVSPEFHTLQYTFLSQMGHRADFRQRLATLYEGWRAHMAGDIAAQQAEAPPCRPVNPRALATFVQALLHGLAMQQAADPAAFDPQEMKELCLDVLGIYLWGQVPTPTGTRRQARPTRSRNGQSTQRRSRPALTTPGGK